MCERERLRERETERERERKRREKKEREGCCLRQVDLYASSSLLLPFVHVIK